MVDWIAIFSNAAQELISPTTAAYALAALGLAIHFGYTGLLNFGQAGFMALGAYGYAISTLSFGFPVWAAVLTGIGAYGLGFLYGRAALGWLDQRYPRVARLIAWIERLFMRWGVALLVVAPAPTVALFAGAARSHFFAFLLAVTAGHALWNSVTYYVGNTLAAWTDLLTSFIGENLLESTLVCVAAVALQQAFSSWSRRRRAAANPNS